VRTIIEGLVNNGREQIVGNNETLKFENNLESLIVPDTMHNHPS